MKKITSAILIIVLLISCVMFTGCNATEQCEYDSFIKALNEIKDAVPEEDADEEEIETINDVTACIYGDEEHYYSVHVTDEFLSLFDGEFVKADRFSGNKVLSVTLSMQYEITLFDSGDAMIYYGFCNVFQSDRQYYTFKLTNSVDALRDYITENGTTVSLED